MIITISTPLSKRVLDVEWLEINTPVGNFIIQPEHAPTIIALSPGKQVTYLLSSGKQESLIVHRGVVEVTRAGATLLINENM